MHGTEEQWWIEKAAERQDIASMNNTKSFYESMRVILGPRVSHFSHLLDQESKNV